MSGLAIETKKDVKEVVVSAVVRRCGDCPLTIRELELSAKLGAEIRRHEMGANGCECYEEDLGVVSYWNKNPLKRIFNKLIKGI